MGCFERRGLRGEIRIAENGAVDLQRHGEAGRGLIGIKAALIRPLVLHLRGAAPPTAERTATDQPSAEQDHLPSPGRTRSTRRNTPAGVFRGVERMPKRGAAEAEASSSVHPSEQSAG